PGWPFTSATPCSFLRFSVANNLLAKISCPHTTGNPDRGHGAFRQFNRESCQPQSKRGRAVGRSYLLRNDDWSHQLYSHRPGKTSGDSVIDDVSLANSASALSSRASSV